jgi:hypothetical protein
MLGVDIDFGIHRVVERPWLGDRCFISLFTIDLYGDWITGDQVRPLGSCSPHLCRLRTDGLAPRASIEHTDHMLKIWVR